MHAAAVSSQTINCLVQASNLPLSVVIVGVGRADFSVSASSKHGLKICSCHRRDSSDDLRASMQCELFARVVSDSTHVLVAIERECPMPTLDLNK